MTRARPDSRLVAGLVGFVLGAAVVWPLAAWRLEDLGLQNDALRLALEDARRQVAQLEASTARLREPVVTSVAVETDVEDPAERTRVEAPLREMAAGLVGRPLAGLDPELLKSALDGRLFEVEGRVYRATLTFALVAPDTRLRFHIAPLTEGGSPDAGSSGP